MFVALYDTVFEFGSDREVFQSLKSNDTKTLICYLADVFGKLNWLNKELQAVQNFDGLQDQNLCFHHETDLLVLTDCET